MSERTRTYDEAIDAMYRSSMGYLEPIDALILDAEQMGDNAAAVDKWLGYTFDENGFDTWWGRSVRTYMTALTRLARTVPELRPLSATLNARAPQVLQDFFRVYA